MTPRTSTERKARATAYRKLAQEAERVEAECDPTSADRERNGVDRFFTCNAIPRAIGHEELTAWKEFFVESSYDLWMDSEHCMSRRILSLCFMAAMVEAGDA